MEKECDEKNRRIFLTSFFSFKFTVEKNAGEFVIENELIAAYNKNTRQ